MDEDELILNQADILPTTSSSNSSVDDDDVDHLNITGGGGGAEQNDTTIPGIILPAVLQTGGLIESDLSPELLDPAQGVVDALTATKRITQAESQLIKHIFFEVAFENRSKEERKALCCQLSRHPAFHHLKLSQLQRVGVSYVGELYVRRKVGSVYARTTEMLRTVTNETKLFLESAAFSALCRIHAAFSCNEYQGLPIQFGAFVSRVSDYARAAFLNDSTDKNMQSAMLSGYSESDNEAVHSFKYFICDCLLPSYQKLWDEFALCENSGSRDANTTKGRPDLSLADAEVQLWETRRSWRVAGSEMLQLFFAMTFAGVCIPDGHSGDSTSTNNTSVVDYSVLFESHSVGSIAYPPPYVLLAIQHGDFGPLKSLLFGTFEEAVYSFYSQHLLIQSRVLNVRDHLFGTNGGACQSDAAGADDDGGSESGASDGSDSEDGEEYCSAAVESKAGENGIDSTHSVAAPSSNSTFVSAQDRCVLYYILGATLRATFGVLRATLLEHRMEENVVARTIDAFVAACTHTVEEAQSVPLPVDLCTQRQHEHGTLVLGHSSLFAYVLSLETEIMLPCIRNNVAVCIMGNQLSVYVVRKLLMESKYEELEGVLQHLLLSHHYIAENLSPTLVSSICGVCANKFLQYYVKLTLSEYVKYINTHATYSKRLNKLSFRVQRQMCS